MPRAIVVLALLLLCAGTVLADKIDHNVRQLRGSSSGKVRLASALALARSKDPRAVIAVSDALEHDDDATIRRVCALALRRMVDARTASDAIAVALDSLARAASGDGDVHVRDTAAAVERDLAHLRRPVKVERGDRPEVFVKVDPTTDPSRRAPADVPERLRRLVESKLQHGGYATSWPGALPSQAELASIGSHAFVVAATVRKIALGRAGSQVRIACTLAIRIAPWGGTDGGEKWEANRAATAQGSATAVTGGSPRAIADGMRDCLDAVAEDLSARQVLPFLKRLIVASN